MLISSCLTDITYRDYTSQLINNNHELNGNTNIKDGLGNTKPDEFYDGVDVVEDGDDGGVIINPPVSIYSYTATGSFTRNNCSSGYQGTTSQYSVTATSTISLVDATNKAKNSLAILGQSYANTVGSCICNLIYVEPNIQYKDGKATITIVVPGATEYALNDHPYQQENQFIVGDDGTYRVFARNGECVVSGNVQIKLGSDYDILNIQLKEIVCGLDYPDDGTITDIKISDRGCGVSPIDDIDNIRIVQSGCNIESKGDITNIKVTNACN